jgi:N-methylhydantoinase B
MIVDWTGTYPQVKGAINNTLSYTKAASYTGVRSVLPQGIPSNEGVFRAIEVICPPGTVGNGVLPAACAARGLTGFRMTDCMFGALAMMLPDKVKAAGDGGNTGVPSAGTIRTARRSSTSTSPAGPGARGRGPTASTATRTCSRTWPRTRSR